MWTVIYLVVRETVSVVLCGIGKLEEIWDGMSNNRLGIGEGLVAMRGMRIEFLDGLGWIGWCGINEI